MTPDERFERQVEFILKQQAQFYADMREMDDRLSRQTARNAEQIERNSEQIERNAEQIEQLTQLVFRTVRVVGELGRRINEN